MATTQRSRTSGAKTRRDKFMPIESKSALKRRDNRRRLQRLVRWRAEELRAEKYAHRQTEAARNKLARKYNVLIETLEQIETLPRGYGRAKRLAGSTLAFVNNL